MDLCLGTVSEMVGGGDAVRRAIDLLGPRGRIFYVHFRQVQGTVPRFAECFIGEGDYSPAQVLRGLIEMGDEAEVKMIRVADEQPDLPIGVAFVDASGRPGWIGDEPFLRIHAPSVRGCWPTVRSLDS